MTQPVSRKWWLELSIAAARRALPLCRQRCGGGGRVQLHDLATYDANDPVAGGGEVLYQGLFGLDKEMKLKSFFAESYTVSPDGLVYTIKLHSGVKFQMVLTLTPRR